MVKKAKVKMMDCHEERKSFVSRIPGLKQLATSLHKLLRFYGIGIQNKTICYNIKS